MTEVIDHEARQAANLAQKSIDDHEKYCGERWDAARIEWIQCSKDIRGLYTRNWILLVAVLGSAMSVIFKDLIS